MFFFFFFNDNGDLVQKELSYTEQVFEDIKHIDEFGNEFWYAREFSKVLEYKDFRNFEAVIFKAMEACRNSKISVHDHFVDVTEMVYVGSTAKRRFHSYKLTRYACYLIVQNADPSKEVVALGQTYFAVKARQQELIENYERLSEERRRIAIREQMAEHNKRLVEAAHDAGVITNQEYAIFQDCGYKGLYGGLGAKQIHERKGLNKKQKILDYMDYEELAANLFRATQTEAKMRRENIRSKSEANKTHYEVGKKVRQTIAELGGTMPEDLPPADKSVQELKRKHSKLPDADQLSLFDSQDN